MQPWSQTSYLQRMLTGWGAVLSSTLMKEEWKNLWVELQMQGLAPAVRTDLKCWNDKKKCIKLPLKVMSMNPLMKETTSEGNVHEQNCFK